MDHLCHLTCLWSTATYHTLIRVIFPPLGYWFSQIVHRHFKYLYLSGLCNEEGLNGCRNEGLLPSLDFWNSPSLTQSRPITYQTYLAPCAQYGGDWHEDDYAMMTSSWLNSFRGERRSERFSWYLGAGWVFHSSTPHYRELESVSVKTHHNFSITPLSVVGHGLQLIQRWNAKPLWKEWTWRECLRYPILL